MASKAVVKYRTRTVSRRGGRRKSQFTIPLAVVAGFAPGVIRAWRWHNWESGLHQLVMDYTGYNPWAQQWRLGNLMPGLVPVLAGYGIHRFVGGKLGVNRALAKAGIPFIRL